jgi:hypothetical protein
MAGSHNVPSTSTISRAVIPEGFEREIDDLRRLVRTAGFGRHVGCS